MYEGDMRMGTEVPLLAQLHHTTPCLSIGHVNDVLIISTWTHRLLGHCSHFLCIVHPSANTNVEETYGANPLTLVGCGHVSWGLTSRLDTRGSGWEYYSCV